MKRSLEGFSRQERLRTITSEGSFFESLGFQYYGPILHTTQRTYTCFAKHKKSEVPVTARKNRKGKGFKFANEDIDKCHGMSPFDIESGKTSGKAIS